MLSSRYDHGRESEEKTEDRRIRKPQGYQRHREGGRTGLMRVTTSQRLESSMQRSNWGVSDVVDKRDGRWCVQRPKEKEFLYKGGSGNANPTSWFCGMQSREVRSLPAEGCKGSPGGVSSINKGKEVTRVCSEEAEDVGKFVGERTGF